ncbi:otospiralin-like [Ranitomeya variabilis]|uniref:otospiralin-like n=1 Tax=Ranitomeya variabilis TaxID=490064 RepID=UPI0040565E21
MSATNVLFLTVICLIYLASFSSPAVIRNKAEIREKREMPNWSMSASDFYGWVDELRRLAAYDKSNEMARIYWAHFPLASHLGFDHPDDEE